MSIGKRLALIAAFLALPVLARADVIDSTDFKIPQISSDPLGSCINGASYIQTTTSHLWLCALGGWIDATGSGGPGAATSITPGVTTVSGKSDCFAFADASGLFQCDNTLAKLNSAGTGNGILVVKKTVTGATASTAGLGYAVTLPVGAMTGAVFDVTSITGTNSNQTGVNVLYRAGYTGSGRNWGLEVDNLGDSTGSSVTGAANIAVAGYSASTATGKTYVGVMGQGDGRTSDAASTSWGVVGTATGTKASNVGVQGSAANATINVGGSFWVGTAPTLASTAAIFNNGSSAIPIIIAQDNGTTVKTIEDGGAEWGKMGTKTLTESSATLFVRVGVPSNGRQGGVIEYCVDANDATDYQERCGSVPFSGSNKGGTETCAVGTPSDVVTETQGASTLTVSFDTETAGTNTCGIRANAASSLVQTTLQINYTVRMFGNAATAVTPQ